MIIIPRRHYTQPQGRVAVAPEWSEALVGIFSHDSIFSVDGTSVQREVSQYGIALSSVSSVGSGAQVSGSRLLAGLQQSTAIAVASLDGMSTVAGGGRAFYCERSESVQIYKFGMANSSQNHVSFVVRNSANTLINSITRVEIPVERRQFFTSAFVTNGPTERRIYCAGQSAANNTNVPITYTKANDARLAGDAVDTACAFDGGLFFVALYSRPMSDGELDEIDAHPWQLFRPDPIRIYSLPSGPIVPSLSGLTTSHITSSGARHSLTLTF